MKVDAPPRCAFRVASPCHLDASCLQASLSVKRILIRCRVPLSKKHGSLLTLQLDAAANPAPFWSKLKWCWMLFVFLDCAQQGSFQGVKEHACCSSEASTIRARVEMVLNFPRIP